MKFKKLLLLNFTCYSFDHTQMDERLTQLIPNPGIPGSKALRNLKVDPALHPSEVFQTSSMNSWGFSGKKSNAF